MRFFGIGNELEAILTTLTLVGTGAWLECRRRGEAGLERRTAAIWFVGVALVAAAAFAPGRFGADVGAAIVLGVGGATASVIALGLERKRAILIVAGGGLLALAALLVADLILGGAHLSRTVLGAGGTGDLLDVLDRRVTLMVHTFVHPVYPELLAASVVLAGRGGDRPSPGDRLVGRALARARRLARRRGRGPRGHGGQRLGLGAARARDDLPRRQRRVLPRYR